MVSAVEILANLTLLLDLTLLASLGLYGYTKILGKRPEIFGLLEKTENVLNCFGNELVFLLSLTASSGSLYMSQILGWTPCMLCWVQRAFIYPIAVVSGLFLISNYIERQEIFGFKKESFRDFGIAAFFLAASYWNKFFLLGFTVFLAVKFFLEDIRMKDHVLPLATLGLPVSIYHALDQRLVQFSEAGCSIFEVSCKTKYTFHYDYITIPVMAATALMAIIVVMWKFSKEE
ncbi:MAG: disulfide bond formation protein B [Nanohaloarchaea archaeon]|nr:disulfide bond formation protein B [Candidatus Nanohaloarchaea archaeon]